MGPRGARSLSVAAGFHPGASGPQGARRERIPSPPTAPARRLRWRVIVKQNFADGTLGETLGNKASERVVVEGDSGPARRLRLGLQPRFADDRAEGLPRVEPLLREETGEDRQRGHASGAGPDAFDPREPPLRRENLLILGVAEEALALAEEPEDPRALLAGIARRQALRHGVADLERRDRRAVAERARDGVGPRRLGGDHQRCARDPARLVHLAKTSRRRDERLAHRDRDDDDVQRRTAYLLGDLVGERFLALLLVGVARRAAVEEQTLLDEPVPDRDEVVVDALVDDEVRRRRRHVQELRRRGPLIGEDERGEAGARRVGGDRRARVARADDRRRAVAEAKRGGDGRRR